MKDDLIDYLIETDSLNLIYDNGPKCSICKNSLRKVGILELRKFKKEYPNIKEVPYYYCPVCFNFFDKKLKLIK